MTALPPALSYKVTSSATEVKTAVKRPAGVNAPHAHHWDNATSETIVSICLHRNEFWGSEFPVHTPEDSNPSTNRMRKQVQKTMIHTIKMVQISLTRLYQHKF